MLNITQLTFRSLVVHRVGNKLRDEGVLLAQQNYSLADEVLRQMLLDYFLSPFKNIVEFFRFTHPINLQHHPLQQWCAAIFDDPEQLFSVSQDIARHLYQQSNHPKISGGELYVTYLSDCLLDDELVNAIGIFKSENKDLYLKPTEHDNTLSLYYESGINIRKLDKGCLIFNTASDDGYRMLVVDKQSKANNEAQYWLDDFLQTERTHDRAYTTQHYIEMCRAFCDDLSPDLDGKKDEVLLMSKSLQYFAEHDNFDAHEFADTVLEDGSRTVAFHQFRQQYEQEMGLEPADTFRISPQTVRQMKRKFKNLIQLDTGIEIKLNGETAEPFIQRGYDSERKMHYYQVFFTDEN